jgi:hypothetical protein
MATKSIEETPTSIHIGPADAWGWDQAIHSPEDRLAFLYEVAGTPGGAQARIDASRDLGKWTFSVNFPGSGQRAQCSYNSKEAAVEALRAWIANSQR